MAINSTAKTKTKTDWLPYGCYETVHKALMVYKELRKEQAYFLVDTAAASGRALHLGKGEAKEERDRQLPRSGWVTALCRISGLTLRSRSSFTVWM